MNEEIVMITGIADGNKVYCPQGSELYKHVEADDVLEAKGMTGEHYMNFLALVGGPMQLVPEDAQAIVEGADICDVLERRVEKLRKIRDEFPKQSGLVDLREITKKTAGE